MTNEHYDMLATELLQKAKELGARKGKEYAHTENGDADRLKNFKVVKDVAQLKTEGQAILNYMLKSIMSLGYHASDTTRPMNEPVEERCIDIINYVLLYYAWAMEDAGLIDKPRPFKDFQEELDQRALRAKDIYCSHGS